jgi:hypothetical protein
MDCRSTTVGEAAVRDEGRRQSVDTGTRADCLKHSFSGLLQQLSVLRHRIVIVFVILSLFVTVLYITLVFTLYFTSHSYLHCTLSPSIILQCFKTD